MDWKAKMADTGQQMRGFTPDPHILSILHYLKQKINCTKNFYKVWLLFLSTVCPPGDKSEYLYNFPPVKVNCHEERYI